MERMGGDILTREQEHAKALAQQLEEQKEQRIAHLQQAAARRMMHAGLTKGWQSWQDAYLERQRHLRMMAAAAGRLQRPKLAAAVTAWREDWAEEQRRILEEGQALLRAEQAKRDRLGLCGNGLDGTPAVRTCWDRDSLAVFLLGNDEYEALVSKAQREIDELRSKLTMPSGLG